MTKLTYFKRPRSNWTTLAIEKKKKKEDKGREQRKNRLTSRGPRSNWTAPDIERSFVNSGRYGTANGRDNNVMNLFGHFF